MNAVRICPNFLVGLTLCIALNGAARGQPGPDLPSADPAALGQSQRVYIAPAHNALPWQQAAPRHAEPVPLSLALMLLLPTEISALPLSADKSVTARLVQLPSGLTRRQALAQVVPAGMALLIFENSLVLTPGKVVAGEDVVAPQRAAYPASSSAAPKATFSANLSDQHLRGVVTRWAREAAWTFDNTLWMVNRDLPVRAASTFDGDFRTALLSLLKTTELTDLALKPCFHSNRVLRIVAQAEKCDRSKD